MIYIYIGQTTMYVNVNLFLFFLITLDKSKF